MSNIVDKQDLPGSERSRKFEGYLYGDVPVSFFLSDSPPGFGPKLHRHPYPEVFVVQEGQLTFTVGDQEVVATAGQIVIAPPNTPHRFVNSGDGIARHIDIHTSPRMIQAWVETD